MAILNFKEEISKNFQKIASSDKNIDNLANFSEYQDNVWLTNCRVKVVIDIELITDVMKAKGCPKNVPLHFDKFFTNWDPKQNGTSALRKLIFQCLLCFLTDAWDIWIKIMIKIHFYWNDLQADM